MPKYNVCHAALGVFEKELLLGEKEREREESEREDERERRRRWQSGEGKGGVSTYIRTLQKMSPSFSLSHTLGPMKRYTMRKSEKEREKSTRAPTYREHGVQNLLHRPKG